MTRRNSWFGALLGAVVLATQETGAELAVALLPELRNLKDGLAERSYAKVERHFLDRGVPVVNLLGALKSGDSSVYWVAKDDPHPNALAQMEIARMLRDRLFSSCRMPASPGKKGRKEK